LIDAVEVALAGDFCNECGRETLGAELLVYAEEVYLGGFEDFAANADVGGNAGDEGDELAGFGGANTNVPFFAPAG
jgi:hypothetical protein